MAVGVLGKPGTESRPDREVEGDASDRQVELNPLAT